MPTTLRRIARVSVLALMIGFAPVASAVGQSTGEDDVVAAETRERPKALSRAAAQAASEMAAPGAVDTLVEGAVKARTDAIENRRAAAIIDAEAKKLKPGKFAWQPELSAAGPVEIVVSLKAQRAYIYRGERLIGVTSVSTGRKGNDTPTGSFAILQKKKMHFSNLYNNAPMPNMQRMTWDGVALHAGNIPGYAASHGCVRLPREFSELLFKVTSIGSVVHVVDDTPPSGLTALAEAREAAFRNHAEAAARAVEKASRRAAGGNPQARAR
jgi:lipoprotein-anchoring transpeptidase ErfK/SrfK